MLSVLGRGGMGIVYKARDPFIDRIVAVKTIHLDSQIEEEDLLARLEMEARSAGRLQHPNICTVFDFGKEDDLSFIVIEFAEGSDLQQLIDNRAKLSLPQKIDLIVQVAHGLGYAHEMGVVHRDMKPSNIRVTSKGTAKIIDFGLARFDTTRLTKTGFVSGTVAYMSPERFSGQSGPSDDIFALGAVAYEFLTYERAYPGSSPPEVMMKIISAEPPKPSEVAEVPAVVDPIIRKCMARDVADRYKTAMEFAADLEDIYTHEAYLEFLRSPDRSPEFSEAVADWVAVVTSQSSGRSRLRATGVPTLTLEKKELSPEGTTGKTAIQSTTSPAAPTEVVRSGAFPESQLTSVTATDAADATEIVRSTEVPMSKTVAYEETHKARPESSPTLIDTKSPLPLPAGEPKESRRRRLLVYSAIAVFVALVAAGILFVGGATEEDSASNLAITETATPPAISPPVEEETGEGPVPGEGQLRVLAALREEISSVPFNTSERIRLREADATAELGATQIEQGNDSEGIENLDRSIAQLRELIAAHEQRLAAERRPEPQVERPSRQPSPRQEPARESPVTATPVTPSQTREPVAEAPKPEPPQPTRPTVPQRTEADARGEIQDFIRAVATAYENRDVGFFQLRYLGYNEAVADAIRNSPSSSVEIAIDAIDLEGTDRASVSVTRTDRFSDRRIPPGVQKLTYELRRIDGQWKIVSFSRR